MYKYKRLSLIEREEISRSLSQGISIRAIARSLDRSASTISREINRFKSNKSNYRAVSSHSDSVLKSKKRRFNKRKLMLNKKLLAIVEKKLKLFWSPQQISKFLRKTFEDDDMQISAEAIYSYIYVLPRGTLRKEFTDCLRRTHKKRRKMGHSQKGQKSDLEGMISIEERPAEVADRTIPGHWEGDLIIGGAREQTALGTLVERTTRSVLLVPLKSKKAKEVRKAFARELKQLPKKMRLSMTYDQGREMAEHKLFTKETKMQVYFCHPQSPWERGTNENTNSLIRQFFPKGTNFNEVSRYQIKKAQRLLNERPRKTLDWRTPKEAMAELLR